jgi:hypothetical protein
MFWKTGSGGKADPVVDGAWTGPNGV